VATAAVIAAAALALLGIAADSGSTAAFVGGIAAIALGGAGAATLIERARRAAPGAWRHTVNLAVFGVVAAIAWFWPPSDGWRAVADILSGERASEARVVRHQVLAAYRRLDLAAERKIVERAEVYAPSIQRAARAFAVDPDLLMGIAAAESSFYPRDSRDGGRGLFQITAVPPGVNEAAKRALGAHDLDPLNQLHNAFLAAATLASYREQMDGDLFLTLLAYNIGPHNGGLRTIMQQYGARNFAQVQPYLQALPRDYPIRVLSAALAYRLWRERGELPRFELQDGTREVQSVGIPGLDGEPQLVRTEARAEASR
jgi:soluble lytic murein transglycosylase-like protein